jgi:hypothetical protein
VKDWMIERLTSFAAWEEHLVWERVPLSPEQANGLPPGWQAALTGEGSAARRLAMLWGPLADRLPLSFAAFGRHLAGLALLQTGQRPRSLVYAFANGEDDVAAARGFLPCAAPLPILSALSIDLAPLLSVHDGLVHFMSYDGGPLPSSEWMQAGDRAAGEPTLLKIAMDGSDAFGFDVSQQPARAYHVSPAEDMVEFVDDPWGHLDGLLVRIVPGSGS